MLGVQAPMGAEANSVAWRLTVGIAEGGIFTVRPPGSKIVEDDKRTIADSGYVCPAFSNTHVRRRLIVKLC